MRQAPLRTVSVCSQARTPKECDYGLSTTCRNMNGNAIDVTGVHQKFNDALILAC